MDSITKNFTDTKYLEEFSRNLKTDFIGKNIIYLPGTTSTNNLAKEKSSYLSDGTVIISDTQTEGRGRKNRGWFSPAGQGLWFSVIIKEPQIKQEKLPFMNILISVTIAECLIPFHEQVQIKWPNDVLVKRKKVCGILSEVQRKKTELTLIAGIGINTGNNIKFPKDLAGKSGSIKLKGEKAREEFFKTLLESLEKNYNIILNENNDEIIEKWKKFSITLTSQVYLRGRKGNTVICKPLDIGPAGELILIDPAGKKRIIYTDDEIVQKIQGL